MDWVRCAIGGDISETTKVAKSRIVKFTDWVVILVLIFCELTELIQIVNYAAVGNRAAEKTSGGSYVSGVRIGNEDARGFIPLVITVCNFPCCSWNSLHRTDKFLAGA